MRAFESTFPGREVMFGAGSVARLGEAADRHGWRRLLLCASPTLRRDGHARAVEEALGARLAATFDRVRPHVLEEDVAEALALAEAAHVDAIVGLGGGSAIGIAKAVSFGLEERRGGREGAPTRPDHEPLVPVAAIPTTYAGSEMTPVYGVTRHEGGAARKVTVTDPRIAPRLVVYDPELTLDLAPELTASTGINALAHCVEALYSITRNPLATAAARAGIETIAGALPRCRAAGADLEARGDLLAGAYLAGTALATVAMGLHHGLCHVLGGTAGVPHGVANAIILPHAMRFNLEVTAPALALAAPALGFHTSGQSDVAAAAAATAGVATLIERLGLPRHLREVGVAADDLPRLAEIALLSRAVRNNPRPVRDAAEIEALLRAAW